MRTGVSSAFREGIAQIITVVVLFAGLAACSSGGDEPEPGGATEQVADQVTQIKQLLHRRAAAVDAGDRSAFLADVDPGRKAFQRTQSRYFDNLRELPLERFAYALPAGGVTNASGGRLRATVALSIELEGFDAVPVETPAHYSFRHTDDGRLVLTAVRDRAWEKQNNVDPAPWDLGRIEVESTPHVLGIFDPDSVDAAYQIMDSVEDGIAVVDQEVPLKWSGKVVVYALSDIDVLRELDNLPGGDPDRLDGVAFPVRAGPGSRKLAGTRFMLHPRMIYRNDATRDRLIRHELTHVAIGRRDDSVPTWLSEGIAEYVSVQPIATYDRMISREAVDAAGRGLEALPTDATFNGAESGANYGIAWYACEYIAATYGEEALWRLFDAMRHGNGTAEAGQDAVLRSVLGIDSHELARGAGQKIVSTFG
ncbi:hypothetical protein [Nocardioides sp. Root140]|uniref:hypothetical protein n=1 Tax=Nocardioides sp. Root140 TaxID=1736460 RepID=UPI0006FEEBC5|nr:hypothetical protein [Nocardioides sp. Root140]KQY64111.1 hypothetical protein ASD30_03875 [Nocardioides sp. Root140]